METPERGPVSLQSAALFAGLLLAAGALEGCSLEASLATCAHCGEIRSITPRQLRSEIRLLTDAPQTIRLIDAGDEARMVYDVRVRMDRGGSRDFVLSDEPSLRVGDRVEIRQSLILPYGGPDRS